jgi:hypothetical protein
MRVEVFMEPSDRSASWVTSSAKLARNGSANVIGIEGLRKALGERWTKLREDAGHTLEELLRRQLRPDDFFLRLDDMHVLVIMPKMAAVEGEITCLRIAYELNRTFAGSCSVGELDVTPARAVGDNIIEVDAFDRAALVDLAGRAGLQLAPDGETVALLDASQGVADVAVAYAPVWDSEFQVIRAYRCQSRDGHHQHGPENSDQRIRAVTDLTLTLLERGTAELDRHLRRGERFVLALPVSYEVLLNPLSRMAFLSRCRALPADMRPYLAYTIKDLPPGIPQPRVADLVSILHAFCGAVLVRAPRRVKFDVFRASGVKALGLSLGGMHPDDYQVELGNLAAEARRSGLIAFAEHVDSEEALRVALDRGVRWLSGTAVAPATSEPGPLKSLPRAQLFHRAA